MSSKAILEYKEETADYSEVAISIPSGPLHEGELTAGTSFEFELALPPDALPSYKSPPDGGGRCVVPRVIGLRLGAAKRKIRQRRCSVGRVRRAHSTRVGRVIGQRPRPGTIRRGGYPVALVVGRR